MKYLSIFLISFFLWSAPPVHAAQTGDSMDAVQNAGESSSAVANINQRITTLERSILAMRQDQEKIEAKNAEIKQELANLRVWIHRR